MGPAQVQSEVNPIPWSNYKRPEAVSSFTHPVDEPHTAGHKLLPTAPMRKHNNNKPDPSVARIRAAAWEITQEYGACAFLRLCSGSARLPLKRPNGLETTGALVWRNGRAWTVDIVTIGDHHHGADSPMVLRVPAWKRDARCDLYVLMLHVDYDAHYQAPLTTRPCLRFLGVAQASTVFDSTTQPADATDFVVPYERLVPLEEAIACAQRAQR